MLVKIESYYKDKDFWLFDNIRKISVSKELYLRPGVQEIHNYFILTMPETDCKCKNDDERCSNCRIYKVLICKLDDYTEMSIAFDSIAYITNDNGKTVEKIVVNYND